MYAEKFNVVVPDLEYYQGNINCQNACPAGTDARGYVNAIAAGRYDQAYIMAREPNPFASTCGRICPAYCEQACRRGAIDKPVAIRALKRFVTEKFGVEARLRQPASPHVSLESAPGNSETIGSEAALVKASSEARRQGKVAIVGSGPSGLTAAQDLSILGYKVTILEALSFAGGKWRVAIPRYRIPREVVDAEIEAILSLGVELKLNVSLGKDYTLEGLKKQGFTAIYLATGSDHSRKLSRPQDGIFGEGDVALGNVAVIDAVAAGHAAARQIDGYLAGSLRLVKQGRMATVDARGQLHPDYLSIEKENPPMDAFISPESLGELERPFSESDAQTQAERCLRCHIQTVFDGDKCVLCGGCVDVCPNNCYKMVHLDDIHGDENLQALLQARYGKSLDDFLRAEEKGDPTTLKTGTAIIKDETACIRCGLCARRCPVEAITMEAFHFEELWVSEQQAEKPSIIGERV